MKATKKNVVIAMTAAVAALGSHANDPAAMQALADMANVFPNNIIRMVPSSVNDGPFVA